MIAIGTRAHSTAMAWAILGIALGASARMPASAAVPSAGGGSPPRLAGRAPAEARPSPSAQSPSAPTATPLAELLGPGRVLAYIKQTLDWYRQMQSLGARPRFAGDADARARLQTVSLDAVRLAFDYGHAAAAALALRGSAAGAPSPAGAPTRLDQAAARVDLRMAALESQIAAVGARLARAPAKQRRALEAQRAALMASLALERQVDSAVDALQRFQDSTLAPSSTGALGLEGEIETLQRSVPEVLTASVGVPGRARARPSAETARVGAVGESPGTAQPDVPSQSAATAAPLQAESAGIVTLIGEWVDLEGDARRLSAVSAATRSLRRRLDAVHAPLRDEARELVRTPTPPLDTGNVAELETARSALAAATARFKSLSRLLVPLAEESLSLADAQDVLSQWSESLDASKATIARYLLTQVAVLVAWIVAVLVVSETWRRALFRYLHDARRRSHFQTLRRVTVAVSLVLVLVFGLVAQIGSLATYVGFLTAGLAVALQNVILAIFAYFLLIGRYGVRIGDRITVVGVTGRVAEIGLIRIYLIELAGPELRPTGRLVVLSNAVLFQPQAMFKQIPGADYLWHGIAVTLAVNADVAAAQKRLRSAIDAVYEKYRPQIEKRHAAEKYLVDFDTSMPWPEVSVRFTEQGLKFEIRYPVETDQAVLVDREMLDALRAALAAAPALPVAASGEPALEPSAG